METIFDKQCTQRQIFQEIIPLISKWQQGYNITIFTYGQTGSGKTYTMFGSDWNNIIRSQNKNKQSTFLRNLQQDQNYAGIIPRTINHLFLQIQNNKNVKVYCSFIQLYNQIIMDLLDSQYDKSGKKLKIHQNSNDGIYVSGLLEMEVTDVDQCLQIMQRGQRNRVVRQTHMNVKSSRSHSLFQLIIQQVFPITKTYRRMKINLCDLAGSQKINKNQVIDQNHFDQLRNINLSLTTLGRVINCLSSKHKKAPFRQSKLTRLLQDSLGGNTFTTIIATITTKASCLQQSLNTLKFLERAKQIKTILSTRVYHDNPTIKNLQKQITYLKDILKIKRNGIQIDYEIIDKLKKLQSQNQKLKQIANQDFVDKLIKENTHLKQELQRKNNQEILDKSKRNSPRNIGQRSSRGLQKVQLSSDKQQTSKSSNITKRLQHQKRFMVCRSQTNKQKSRRSTKSSQKIFPRLTARERNSSSSNILKRILQIQKAKKQNQIKLHTQLSMVGKLLEKKTNLTPRPKFACHQHWKNY